MFILVTGKGYILPCLTSYLFGIPFIKTADSLMCLKRVKMVCFTTQYPILRIAQNALHFTSLADLFNRTPSQLLWEASIHRLQLMPEGCSQTYPPLSIARNSFIQLTELEQRRVKNFPKVLSPQHMIRTWVLLIDRPKLYP